MRFETASYEFTGISCTQISRTCVCKHVCIFTYIRTHTHTRQNWIFEEIHQELNPVTCKLKLKWQARWVDQTQYPMIVVASLSAVPQSCHTPLLIKRREERKRKKGKFYIYLDVTHTHPAGAGSTLKGKRKEKADTNDGQKARTAQGGKGTNGPPEPT